MIEFGSDFHFIPNTDFLSCKANQLLNRQLYANGRQSIQHLLSFKKRERIWVPEYFCYEIVSAIKDTGINVRFYPDAPGLNDTQIVKNIPFVQNDVLLRMNYFGLRSFRDNTSIPVDVIEDHSHDITGTWASTSNADWCIASIRKTIPVPEGGVLWSPKNNELPIKPEQSAANILLATKRGNAMKLKSDYLAKDNGQKQLFRKLFIETETDFEKLPISEITPECRVYLSSFDFQKWDERKRANWLILSSIRSENIEIHNPETEDCNIFSFVFTLKSEEQRDNIRNQLIENNLYPVVLWHIPENTSAYSLNFSRRMLSIPCDARFSQQDIFIMKQIIEDAIS
jgi:hypothetical protein